MNVLEEIRNRLKRHPELKVIDEEDTITVESSSPDGFDVWFSDDENEYTVGFEGWHEHFEKSDAESALSCFGFGLSNQCRLKVISRGGQSYRWTVESFEDGKWVTYSTTGLLWMKFWNKPVVKYLSNDIIKVENA